MTKKAINSSYTEGASLREDSRETNELMGFAKTQQHFIDIPHIVMHSKEKVIAYYIMISDAPMKPLFSMAYIRVTTELFFRSNIQGMIVHLRRSHSTSPSFI